MLDMLRVHEPALALYTPLGYEDHGALPLKRHIGPGQNESKAEPTERPGTRSRPVPDIRGFAPELWLCVAAICRHGRSLDLGED